MGDIRNFTNGFSPHTGRKSRETGSVFVNLGTWTFSRADLRRRKITREDKIIPTLEQIRSILKNGQDTILNDGHNGNTVFNMDQTAYTWAIGPTYLYVPVDEQTATNLGIANSKIRISAVITVGANGFFAPLIISIKHSVCSNTRPDQSTMRVLRDLHNKPEMGGI